MASILRQIVASPRLRHPETGLDLCYVTDEIIATSGPSSTYPRRAYRNPTDSLVRFLDLKHGEDWAIWEFRAEGTGYPDEEVYGRIHHFPFPDHHPPPFALIPHIMASMRNWLLRNGDNWGTMEREMGNIESNDAKGKRVVVVHCKAGKGRSGTIACSFLISERGWEADKALRRFTERRMRARFGEGVSIPSQLRWVSYVDRWTKDLGKVYVERPVEVMEVHIWGLRDGVEVDVEGFVEEGRRIKCFHRFSRSEGVIIGSDSEEENEREENGCEDGKKRVKTWPNAREIDDESTLGKADSSTLPAAANDTSPPSVSSDSPFQPVISPKPWPKMFQSIFFSSADVETAIPAIILRPRNKVIIPTSDVNISIDRRAMSAYTGWTMVTSVAHVWFNAYFEGGQAYDSGVFEVDWEALDGIRGTNNRGIKALDRLKVVWRYAEAEKEPEAGAGIQVTGGRVISEPAPGEPVLESHAADWRGQEQQEHGGIDPNASSEDLLRRSL
ncbi:dual specificity phosphatase [Histoplasma capsulatum var. duboisii H88]|uniref:phosphatidylinositol-3,4,5-trisphosphate 3-phosphatase n=1 Tax=Ajellomyces capsulatus (strain H88) TaxID=544711 RepID=F0UJV5_AJEC8|nr:dual specificity phosphatase [Histoplasma capsulatum var. duboisii H88]QSS57271.1 dual specificity phosphatase [Histoplasma capsulatum var. duboisii H88]